MLATFLFVCGLTLACFSSSADEPTAEALLKLHLTDASDYSIAKDAASTELLQLRTCSALVPYSIRAATLSNHAILQC